MKDTLIIFDCFGVLCTEISPRWFRLRYEEEEAKRLKALYYNGADKGEYNVYELLDKLESGLKIPKDTIISEWKMLLETNDELISFIKSLKGKYHLALLTNVVKDYVELLYGDKDYFTKIFDKSFNSWEYNMRKPEHEFYELCVNSYKDENIKHIYFIDDSDKNLVGIDDLGITPIKYINNKELFNVFDKLGIK